jgi:K+-sensing histidine kinase KdpD
LKKYAPQPGWRTAQTKVIESGEPMMLEELPDIARDRMAHDETHAAILRAAGIRSMMVVPLSTWGRTFGALTFATAESGRLYSPAHFRLAQTVASRVAMAIENVRLFTEKTRAVAARDTVLAVVSHDLRNPLNAIHLKTHLMSNSPDSQRRSDGRLHCSQSRRDEPGSFGICWIYRVLKPGDCVWKRAGKRCAGC